MKTVSLESLEKSMCLSSERILAAVRNLGIKPLYNREGLCFEEDVIPRIVSCLEKELPQEDLISDREFLKEFPEYSAKALIESVKNLGMKPIQVNGTSYFNFNEVELLIEECKKYKPEEKPVRLKTYRLCILKDNVWYVVHSGHKDMIRKWSRKLCDEGYLIKVKPNKF